jgi:hypothetical protein
MNTQIKLSSKHDVNYSLQLYPFEKSQQQNNIANVSTQQETAAIRMTKNRQCVLEVLDAEGWSDETRGMVDSMYPPMTVNAIFGFLDFVNWDGKHSCSIKQLERTLRDLATLGLVRVTKQKAMVHGSLKCEKSVNHYELPHQSEKNSVKKYVVKALSDADYFFYIKRSSPKPFTKKAKNYEVVLKQIKTAIQRTHPDKFGDDSFMMEFHLLQKTQEALKDWRIQND